jgi:hypothetical protein
METLLVYPENNKQLKAIKAVMTTLNVKLEKKKNRLTTQSLLRK